MSSSRRTWLLCLLLLGNLHLSTVNAETSTIRSFPNSQTSDQKQDDEDKEKDKDKKPKDDDQDDDKDKVEDKGKDKDKDKDKDKGEDKDKDEDKKPDDSDMSGQEDDSGQDETSEGTLESAGVAAGETRVHPNPVGRTSSGEGRYFVGEVTVNDGSSILIGGTRVEGDLRWLSVLRAGMWAEAYGHWENDVFVADGVSVLESDDWAYYRGPAAALGVTAEGYATVEAWTANGSPAFEGIRTAPDGGQAVQLVAYFDGENLVAVPANFPPPPDGAATGWVELKGYFDGEKVVWESAAAFP